MQDILTINMCRIYVSKFYFFLASSIISLLSQLKRVLYTVDSQRYRKGIGGFFTQLMSTFVFTHIFKLVLKLATVLELLIALGILLYSFVPL